MPKLFVKADPESLSDPLIDICRSWRAESEVTVRGHHCLQEDSPDQIGQAIAERLQDLA